MDLLTEILRFLHIPVFEKQAPSPASDTTTAGQPTGKSTPEASNDPTDDSVPAINLLMFKASQPTNLLALSSDQIAPSANNGAELSIAERYDTKPAPRYVTPADVPTGGKFTNYIPDAGPPVPRFDETQGMSASGPQHILPLIPPIQEAPYDPFTKSNI